MGVTFMAAPFTGNAAYCFSNSLHMVLLGSGAVPDSLPAPGFLECLTGMPFGKTYWPHKPAFWPSAPGFNPERGGGLALATATLGWECDTWYVDPSNVPDAAGGDDKIIGEALDRLRFGLQHGPVLLGPVDFGFLSYYSRAAQMAGADHYVVALDMDGDHVVLHDPAGIPYAVLPVSDLLQAWRAERIGFKRGAFTMRSAFRQVDQVGRQAMIERTLPVARRNLTTDPGGPAAYGGSQALTRLAHALRGDAALALEHLLMGFSFPTAARRAVDAAGFLAEAGRPQAAGIASLQARLWGHVCSAGAQQQWATVADLLDRLAVAEHDLTAAV